MKSNRPPLQGGKPGPDLGNRKILLGVSGGIAAYKAVELTRLLIKHGARVQVLMTEAATKFVTPLTFETITGRHVFVDMFPPHGDFSPWHTELASWPDIVVVAPATANHLARLAVGIADDLLSTTLLTIERPRLLCPAMNHRMWANPATQDNVATLKRRGYRFLMPEEGQMARPGEEEGLGRLAEPETIYREVLHTLSAPQDLRGVRVLVTAGRTEESWDPVRVLTNRATGRMGFALAEEAYERGAEVTLVHGPTDVIPPSGVRIRRVTTASEMAGAVKQEFPQCKILLMAAAVADYTFAKTLEHKIKKGEPSREMQLVATEDILRSLSDRKGDRIIVGFALETENLLENALKKLREKHLDIVVANNPLAPGSGFAGETNQVLIIHRGGRVNELPLQSKREAAREILNSVIELYRHPEPEPEFETVETELPDDLPLPDEDELEVEMPTPAVERPAAEPHAPADQRPREERGSRRRHKRRGRHEHDRAPSESQPAGAVPPEPTVEEIRKPAASREPVPESAPVELAMEAVPPPAEMTVGANGQPAAAELPFPAAPGAQTPGHKKSRSRRGGRRSAKARAARQAAERGGPPSPAQETSVPSPAPEVVKRAPAPAPEPVPAPVAAAPSQPDAELPRGARPPRHRRGTQPGPLTPRPTTAAEVPVVLRPEPVPVPVPVPEPAPAPVTGAASAPEAPAAGAPAKKAAAKKSKPRAPRRKPAAKKGTPAEAAEKPGEGE